MRFLRHFAGGPMNRAILGSIALTCVLGCGDPTSYTIITFGPQQRKDDILIVISDTATQFGLRNIGSNSFNDLIAGENPAIWLTFHSDTIPMTLNIDEMWIDHCSDKHRNLATELLTKLKIRGVDASITYQTPKPAGLPGWWYFILAALCAGTGWLGWRRFRHKPIVPEA